MAAVHPAGPEPMIIIFSAISFLHLTGAYCGTPLHDYTLKNSIMHALKKQMRIRIQADSANSILIGFLSN